jgi:hypothetical protein
VLFYNKIFVHDNKASDVIVEKRGDRKHQEKYMHLLMQEMQRNMRS